MPRESGHDGDGPKITDLLLTAAIDVELPHRPVTGDCVAAGGTWAWVHGSRGAGSKRQSPDERTYSSLLECSEYGEL
jgi:hypothetical protein